VKLYGDLFVALDSVNKDFICTHPDLNSNKHTNTLNLACCKLAVLGVRYVSVNKYYTYGTTFQSGLPILMDI
jgi:hypothetical protein